MSSLQPLSPTWLDGLWVLLIDCGGSAEDRRLLSRRAACLHSWLLRVVRPAEGTRLTFCCVFALCFSHAHPPPRPQLPETEGVRLLLHRWGPTTLQSYLHASLSFSLPFIFYTFSSLSVSLHLHFPLPSYLFLFHKHTNTQRNKRRRENRQRERKTKIWQSRLRERLFCRTLSWRGFWWWRLFPLEAALWEWWLNVILCLSAITVMLYLSLWMTCSCEAVQKM